MVANSTALFIKLSSCPAPAVGIQRCHLDAWEVADVHYGQLVGDGWGGDASEGIPDPSSSPHPTHPCFRLPLPLPLPPVR